LSILSTRVTYECAKSAIRRPKSKIRRARS
jgi:hypothetical protein